MYDGGELFAVGHCGGWIDRQIITGFYANQLATPVLVSQQAGGPKSY